MSKNVIEAGKETFESLHHGIPVLLLPSDANDIVAVVCMIPLPGAIERPDEAGLVQLQGSIGDGNGHAGAVVARTGQDHRGAAIAVDEQTARAREGAVQGELLTVPRRNDGALRPRSPGRPFPRVMGRCGVRTRQRVTAAAGDGSRVRTDALTQRGT